MLLCFVCGDGVGWLIRMSQQTTDDGLVRLAATSLRCVSGGGLSRVSRSNPAHSGVQEAEPSEAASTDTRERIEQCNTRWQRTERMRRTCSSSPACRNSTLLQLLRGVPPAHPTPTASLIPNPLSHTCLLQAPLRLKAAMSAFTRRCSWAYSCGR